MLNWTDLKTHLFPIKDYEDLSGRWQDAYAYRFARECFNPSLPALRAFTTAQLGEDTRRRYDAWLVDLTRIMDELDQAGVTDLLDLTGQLPDREAFEGFIARTRLDPADLINILKYLAYWYIPPKKNLRELYRPALRMDALVPALRAAGLRYNLDLLECGRTAAARQSLADQLALPLDALTELVHRADFSRLPWSSTASISNFIGSGCISIAHMAALDYAVVEENFYRWGESIGKNLKHGNEIDNAYRIVRLVPRILSD